MRPSPTRLPRPPRSTFALPWRFKCSRTNRNHVRVPSSLLYRSVHSLSLSLSLVCTDYRTVLQFTQQYVHVNPHTDKLKRQSIEYDRITVVSVRSRQRIELRYAIYVKLLFQVTAILTTTPRCRTKSLKIRLLSSYIQQIVNELVLRGNAIGHRIDVQFDVGAVKFQYNVVAIRRLCSRAAGRFTPEMMTQIMARRKTLSASFSPERATSSGTSEHSLTHSLTHHISLTHSLIHASCRFGDSRAPE